MIMVMREKYAPKFIGSIVWECLPPPHDDQMRIHGSFYFRDTKGRIWSVEKGTVTDGTSVGFLLRLPVLGFLVRLVIGGDQFTGPFRRASVLHDQAYQHGGNARDRAAADRMHYEAARCDGAGLWRADAVHTLLRWFGWKAWRQDAWVREQEARRQ